MSKCQNCKNCKNCSFILLTKTAKTNKKRNTKTNNDHQNDSFQNLCTVCHPLQPPTRRWPPPFSRKRQRPKKFEQPLLSLGRRLSADEFSTFSITNGVFAIIRPYGSWDTVKCSVLKVRRVVQRNSTVTSLTHSLTPLTVGVPVQLDDMFYYPSSHSTCTISTTSEKQYVKCRIDDGWAPPDATSKWGTVTVAGAE